MALGLAFSVTVFAEIVKIAVPVQFLAHLTLATAVLCSAPQGSTSAKGASASLELTFIHFCQDRVGRGDDMNLNSCSQTLERVGQGTFDDVSSRLSQNSVGLGKDLGICI